MNNKSVTEKPSQTALFAALRRFLAYDYFKNQQHGPDNLAIHFLPPNFKFVLKFKKMRENTAKKLRIALPGLNEYMIARTAFFDYHFQQAINQETSQIVILGAGYDSRPYRFLPKSNQTQIFELDTAPTQSQKIEYLDKAKISHDHVRLMPIDFNTQSIEEVLESNGYKKSKKTLFLWEGVTYYLNPQSVSKTLNEIAQNTNPESTLIFDYTIPLNAKNKAELFGVQEFQATMEKEHANESLVFNIEDNKIEEYLQKHNLTLISNLNNQQIEQKYLIMDNNELIGQITGHFRFVEAKIKMEKKIYAK